jgi:outer membrane protein assembly factor BamE (lipoprotein component of BamABCDE complex)
MKQFSSLALRLTAIAMVAGLAACAPRENYRGAVLDADKVDLVTPGKSQSEVTSILGSPSSSSTFAEKGNTWYYISSETETIAFFAEKTVDQRVLAVDFDGSGRVAEVRRYGMKDGKPIEFASRETPTKGKELGLLEQFLGNLGRFNSNTAKGGSR